METTLINHPRLTVTRRTGSEGPRHDPYHYEETTYRTPKGEIITHLGLATYTVRDGVRRDVRDDRLVDYLIGHRVRAVTGYTPQQIERFARKAKSRCPLGGRHDTHSESGFPGETLEWCSKCRKVVDSHFSESAII